MLPMNGNGYRILGYLVWHAGKWYLRRRLPSRRGVVLSSAALVGVLAGGAVLARRGTR
jgi:hypothetical protein